MTRSLAGLANSHNMLPVYSANSTSMIYPRTMPAYQYHHSDTRPAYSSGWANPYSEDNSPVDSYPLDQSSAYLPAPALTTTATHTYDTPSRWTLPTTRSVEYDSNSYTDQEPSYVTQSLPHIQTDNRASTATEVVSPLNMTSLQMNLPEPSHTPRYQTSEAATPQRQLPMPQPSPALTARNVVDQMQDQRLRSAQIGGGNQVANNTLVKPLLPWIPEGDARLIAPSGPVSMSASTHSTTSAPPPGASDCTLGYTTAPNAAHNYCSVTDTPSQLQLDFSAPIPFDVMNMPASTTTYSNFRDYRGSVASPNQSQRQPSQSDSCVVKTDSSPKRSSLSGDSSTSYGSINGHQRTSPSHSHPTSGTTFKIPCRGVHESKHVPFRRSPIANVKSNL